MIRRVFFAWILAAAWCLGSSAAMATELRLRISGPEQPTEARVSLRHADKPDSEWTTTVVTVPGETVIPVDGEGVLTVAVEVPGFWMPEEVIQVGAEGATASLSLDPTGSLRGKLVPVRDADAPDQLRTRFRSAPDSQPSLGEHWVSCDLDGLRFRCDVPAGVLDLGLRSPGHLTIYRWRVTVPSHQTVDLGEVPLQSGSSIIGWVQAPQVDFRFEDVEVTATPVGLGLGPAGEDQRRDARQETASVNDRGFFELAGIPPGSYRVTVRHPDYAQATLTPVEVYDGKETEIRWVHLSPPVALTLHLEPEIDPFDQPWRITLSRESPIPGHWEEVTQESASLEGRLEARALTPGHFRVEIVDSRGSSWHNERVDLTSGDQDRQIQLPFERLEALVVLGEEPLSSARVYFGGKDGAESIRATTNEEGKVYVFLPEREGSWHADVEKLTENLLTRVDGIRLSRLPGEPWATATIDLPDTRLEGRTVDENGRPLTNIRVTVSAEGDTSLDTYSTDPEGEFSARGRRPGTWVLEARHSKGGNQFSSGVVRVDVLEDQQPPPVELILRRNVEMTGLVVAAKGEGIPGAMVLPLLEQPQRNLANTDRRTYTDASGAFRLQLPGAAEGVQLTVFAPGFAVTQVRAQAQREEPVFVPVEPIGGTVRVVLGSEGDPLPPQALNRTYLIGEYWLGFSGFLKQWAQSNGVRWTERGEMIVPALEPGFYTACFDTHDVVYLGQLPTGSAGSCVSGVLEPFGELVLRVPVIDEAGLAGR